MNVIVQKLAGVRFWFAFFLAAILIACGGGGVKSFPYAGTYRGDFNGANPTSIVVSIGSGGITDAAVSDLTGVLASGTGTTTEDGTLSVNLTGIAGSTALTGSFGKGRAQTGLNLNLSGGINANNVNAAGTGNVSVYKGKYKFQFTGSSSGDLLVTISTDGTVYKRVGTTLTKVGTVKPTGAITFGGTNLVTPSTYDTTWTGQLFVTPSSSGGSGTYVDKANSTFTGSWNAVPEEPITPVFTQVTYVKGLNPSDNISVLATSPNGHMVGFSESKAVYWDAPGTDPVELSNPGATTITYMTGVNASGAKVGYSYVIGQNPDSAVPAYWAPGSTGPSVLALPDHYIAGSPSGINDAGTIVGVIVHETNHILKPCVWPAGGGAPFIPPLGDCGGIANNGVVVCLANNGYLENPNAQNVTPIPPANGYAPLSLDGMSAAGVIFGNAPFGADGLKHPIAWPNLTQAGVPLKFIDGYSEMFVGAAGMNGEYVGRGQVSGASSTQAFYWANSGSVALLDDIVKDNVINYRGGLAVFSNGAVLAWGISAAGFPVVGYIQK